MLKRFFRKLNKQRGSATVEAAISFTGFLFVIFTILSLVNLCRAQMLVSTALDTAAKELSQYSYFYKMSGLQKFSENLGQKADRTKINEVIGSVDGFYGSMTEAISGGMEDITNVAEATKDGSLDLSDLETTYGNLQNNGEAISSSIDEMSSKFQDIGDNPMAYMKSLVAIAGSTGLDLAKSHLIAAPLAKMFFWRHFGESDDEASAELERLGVVDGLEGMNFKMSQIFTTDRPEDICLVVFYKLQLLQFFDWEVLQFNMSKHATCRAWLGGDNVQEIVDPPAATTGAGTEGGESGTGTGGDPTDPSAGTTDPTDPTAETTVPTEPEVTEPASTATGYWALTDEYYMSKRLAAFKEYHDKLHYLDSDELGYSYRSNMPGDTSNTMAYGMDVYATWPLYGVYDGVSYIETDMRTALEHIAKGETINKNGEIQNFGAYMKVIYVPENMPEDQRNLLEISTTQAMLEMNEYKKELGLPDNFRVVISVQPAGGNYDYSSGGQS